jgi:hypothetical protein
MTVPPSLEILPPLCAEEAVMFSTTLVVKRTDFVPTVISPSRLQESNRQRAKMKNVRENFIFYWNCNKDT